MLHHIKAVTFLTFKSTSALFTHFDMFIRLNLLHTGYLSLLSILIISQQCPYLKKTFFFYQWHPIRVFTLILTMLSITDYQSHPVPLSRIDKYLGQKIIKCNLTKTNVMYLDTQDPSWYTKNQIWFKLFTTYYIISCKCQNLSKSPRLTFTHINQLRWMVIKMKSIRINNSVLTQHLKITKLAAIVQVSNYISPLLIEKCVTDSSLYCGCTNKLGLKQRRGIKYKPRESLKQLY